MSLERLASVLSSFCRLRLHGRRIFYTPTDSYIWDASSVLFALRKLACRCNERSLLTVFCCTVENVVAEIVSRDEQFLACFLICEVLCSRSNNLVNLLSNCKLLEANLDILLTSLYLEASDMSSGVGNADTPNGPLLSSSVRLLTNCGGRGNSDFCALPKIQEYDDTIAAQRSAGNFCRNRLASKSLSFLLPESRGMGRLLTFCSKMAEKRKYMRACCVRQLDSCSDRNQLRKAIKLSRVDIVFVQRCGGDAIKEVLTQHNVFCVDRLGWKSVEQFSQKLDWEVLENCSEWFFSVQANCKPRTRKCWIGSKQTRAGLLLTVHVKTTDRNPPKVPDPVIKQCSVPGNNRSLDGNRIRCASEAGFIELCSAWRETLLLQFHVALTLLLDKKGSGTKSEALVSRMMEQKFLENVLKTVSLLCRYQL
ncbi:hypothetical protein ABL78_0969 [Leptomonas seymouri]|uniref:Uncharacterized protein n=1 Tax=Leptomonas seymouri TaxID=5684 RepID=A0A0N0P8T5_LEPSE|nr:hypothetical protein ABL78_0969 [Leptomonas seymouri]|eukprot:KPI89897.1 hypothetical protein ABL78_0969 [Leptomonas seymouri]